MDKSITIVVPGAGEEAEARDATIRPHTRAQDVLRSVRLDPRRFRLELKRDGGNVSVSSGDDLYAIVENGEKVFARPNDMVVG